MEVTVRFPIIIPEEIPEPYHLVFFGLFCQQQGTLGQVGLKVQERRENGYDYGALSEPLLDILKKLKKLGWVGTDSNGGNAQWWFISKQPIEPCYGDIGEDIEATTVSATFKRVILDITFKSVNHYILLWRLKLLVFENDELLEAYGEEPPVVQMEMDFNAAIKSLIGLKLIQLIQFKHSEPLVIYNGIYARPIEQLRILETYSVNGVLMSDIPTSRRSRVKELVIVQTRQTRDVTAPTKGRGRKPKIPEATAKLVFNQAVIEIGTTFSFQELMTKFANNLVAANIVVTKSVYSLTLTRCFKAALVGDEGYEKIALVGIGGKPKLYRRATTDVSEASVTSVADPKEDEKKVRLKLSRTKFSHNAGIILQCTLAGYASIQFKYNLLEGVDGLSDIISLKDSGYLLYSKEIADFFGAGLERFVRDAISVTLIDSENTEDKLPLLGDVYASQGGDPGTLEIMLLVPNAISIGITTSATDDDMPFSVAGPQYYSLNQTKGIWVIQEGLRSRLKAPTLEVEHRNATQIDIHFIDGSSVSLNLLDTQHLYQRD